MGCWTIYVVREPDGAVWASGMKYGPTELAPAELDDLLARQTERWVPTGIDATWCRGWFIDRRARRARVYRCWCSSYDPVALDRSLRDGGWAGWDAGVAWEHAIDFNVLAGLPARDRLAHRLDGWIGFPEAGCLTRHPVRDRFVFEWNRETDELAFDWYYEDSVGTVLTTIDADGRVRDHAFDDEVLVEALGHGLALAGELAAIAPVPELFGARSGAVIDLAERAIWLWLDDPIAPATYAELRRRWPGWRVAREPGGFDGHLARTGRREGDPPARAFAYVRALPGRAIALPPLPADEARLLAAIHDDLASDAARLVYADLLLARGDGRGKMIAVGCEHARLPRSARKYALGELGHDLERRYGREHVVGASELRYARGFVSHAAAESVAPLVEHAVLDRIPTLESLRLRTLAPEAVAQLATLPGLARLRAFETRPEPGALARLATIGALGAIEKLAIASDDPRVADELATVLAGPHPFARLTHLHVSGRGFTAGALTALLAGARLDRLVALDLYQLPGLDDGGLRELARCAGLARLERLSVWGAPHDDAPAILAASPHLAGLREWTSDARRAVRLLEALPGLRALALDHRDAEHDIPKLAGCPELARLDALELTGLGPLALAALAESRYLDGLAVLRLAPPFGDHDAALARLRERLGDRLAVTRW